MAITLIAVVFSFVYYEAANAEYGDVVINEFSDEAGMRPVVFPHWFHRIRFRCKVCHGDLGGACHNGNVAWSIENCDLCHSGVPNTPTQVHHSTTQKLVAPLRPTTTDSSASGQDTGEE